MNTKTGFTLLVLSILVVPLLMIAVIIPMVFHFERPKDSIQEIDSIEDFKLYMESESGNKHAADDTENLLFVAVTDGIISASNIDGYNEGAEIRQEEFNNFLTKAFNPDSVQLLRQIPGVADMVIISLPFSINEMMTQGRTVMKIVPALMLFTIIAAATLFSLLILRNMRKKFQLLETAAEEISGGNLEYSITIPGNDQFSAFAETFDRMRIALQEEKNRESRFIMGISHDLKTPLTLIGGYAEALVDDMNSSREERENYLGIINRKLRDLEKKINTLIDYRRIETGEWKTSLSKAPLAECINQLCAVYAEDSEFMKIGFRSDINIPNSYETAMDQSLFSRAIENIIGNSFRYTQEGGTIQFNSYLRDGRGVIEVIDTGKGIDKSELSKIMEPFYRASKSRREPGFGLGLSIVKSICETHGWGINVESETGYGTKITISGI